MYNDGNRLTPSPAGAVRVPPTWSAHSAALGRGLGFLRDPGLEDRVRCPPVHVPATMGPLRVVDHQVRVQVRLHLLERLVP